MKRIYPVLLLLGTLLVVFLATPRTLGQQPVQQTEEPTEANVSGAAEASDMNQQEADIEYTLLTGADYGGLVFVGQGGDIDGEVNPTLTAEPGDVVQITLINADAIAHDLAIDEFSVQTAELSAIDEQATVVFKVDEEGEYVYYCTLPGHRQAGMWGTLRVGEPEQVAAEGVSVIRNPADLPEPVGDREPELVQVELTTEEVTGQLADGTTYDYFTFDGQIPGPMIRVRVGDTVEVTLNNQTSSKLSHNIDLHAVNGPGGGAVHTETAPGETTTFTFEALAPGLYVYHCATPSVAQHIANGMYGLILVEPEAGLPEVDREFYVMQGEVYTAQDYGTKGHLDFDYDAMLDEDPEYFVFNGAANALTTEENALQATVGETVRIYFGVGGPNFTSSFHVIGEIFDRVYDLASLTSEPMTDVQTTLVPPGGATVVEFEIDEPGQYILVDHALSRLERGLAGFLFAEGEESEDVFYQGPAQ
ncbi:MAG: copper-containing nitrite reductase [Anaerolineales bacterium]